MNYDFGILSVFPLGPSPQDRGPRLMVKDNVSGTNTHYTSSSLEGWKEKKRTKGPEGSQTEIKKLKVTEGEIKVTIEQYRDLRWERRQVKLLT